MRSGPYVAFLHSAIYPIWKYGRAIGVFFLLKEWKETKGFKRERVEWARLAPFCQERTWFGDLHSVISNFPSPLEDWLVLFLSGMVTAKVKKEM